MKIKTIELKVHNLHLIKSFYSEKLGLVIQSETNDDISFFAGQSTLRFIKDETLFPEKPYYHFAFNIPENKIEEAVKWASGRVELLKHNGSPIIDFADWNAHSLYFLDPVGNIVEFIARHDLKNTDDTPFSSNSLLSISEIGLPVKDAAKFAQNLQLKLRLSVWDRSSLSTIFTAIGDNNGLIIAVQEGEKRWFPTETPAKSFPVKVVLEGPFEGLLMLNEYGYQIVAQKQRTMRSRRVKT